MPRQSKSSLIAGGPLCFQTRLELRNGLPLMSLRKVGSTSSIPAMRDHRYVRMRAVRTMFLAREKLRAGLRVRIASIDDLQ